MNETATIELLMEKVQQTTYQQLETMEQRKETKTFNCQPKRRQACKQIRNFETDPKHPAQVFRIVNCRPCEKKTQKAHGEPIGDTTVVIQLLTKDLIEKVAAHFQMLVSNTLARKNCQKGSQQTLNQHPPGPSNWEKKPKGGAKKNSFET